MADIPADIARVVAEYRGRIAAIETAYTRAVGPARTLAQARLRDEFGRFMAAVKRKGLPDVVTRQWVTDLPAYQQLVRVAEAGIDDVTTQAVRAIQWRVAEAAQLGKPAADALTAASIGPQGAQLAATGAFGQVNIAAVTQLVGQLQASSPLVNLPGLKGPAIEQMQSQLVRGLANGQHSRTIAREITRTTDIPAARAQTIARTEVHRAYREANRAAYQANPMVGAWRWLSTAGPRTCSACYAMTGTVHSLDEPMGSHPNCRCTQLPVVSNTAMAALGIDMPDIHYPTGEELFADQPESVQREVLGAGKYEAYKAGKITLADTVHVRETKEWGTTRSTASLAEALAA